MTPGLEFGACHRKQLGGVLTPGVDLKNLNEGSKMTSRVRKAVFPVAGLGTRFLPATKAMPTEMLTVVDRPLIQYAVDEAREAGVEEFIFVTGRGKAALEDHFDHAYELEDTLKQRNKDAELKGLAAWQPTPGQVAYTR